MERRGIKVSRSKTGYMFVNESKTGVAVKEQRSRVSEGGGV